MGQVPCPTTIPLFST